MQGNGYGNQRRNRSGGDAERMARHPPEMRNGARIMLMITLAVDTTIPGLKLPTPRSAPIATSANCSPIAGMNQSRIAPDAQPRFPGQGSHSNGVSRCEGETDNCERVCPSGSTVAGTGWTINCA